MVLPTGKAGGIAVMLAQSAHPLVPFPTVRVLEHLFDDDTVRRETAHERVHVTGIERPGITGNEILDGDAIRHRQCCGI
jgi:hypothetical protein